MTGDEPTDTVAALLDMLAERGAEIETLRAAIVGRDAQIARQETALEQYREAVPALRAELEKSTEKADQLDDQLRRCKAALQQSREHVAASKSQLIRQIVDAAMAARAMRRQIERFSRLHHGMKRAEARAARLTAALTDEPRGAWSGEAIVELRRRGKEPLGDGAYRMTKRYG